MTALRFMPPRVQMVDKNGMITRQWYLFLQGVFDRIGGAIGPSTTDVELSDGVFGGNELGAAIYANVDAVGQLPPTDTPQSTDQLQSPTLGVDLSLEQINLLRDALSQDSTEQVVILDAILAELASQRDQIAELIKTVQGIQSGSIL